MNIARYYEIFHRLGPGTQKFLKNLSIITVFFALSKVFSSISMIIVARFLGSIHLGSATLIISIANILGIVMQLGMPIALMKYGGARQNPDKEVATSFFVVSTASCVILLFTWLLKDHIIQNFDLHPNDIFWILGYAVLFTYYQLLTTIYQAYHDFKRRGIVELAFSVLLLPGLLIGHWLFSGNYETMLTAYILSLGVLIPFMVWRYRALISLKLLSASTIKRMSQYGFIAMLSNSGFIMVMLIQPLQIERVLGEGGLGVFRVYSNGSINMAAFITGVFYAVFFPKVSASVNKSAIWLRAVQAWKRACIPLFLVFAVLTTAIVWLSGADEYPLEWYYVTLAALVALLITVQATFGQMIGSQGIVGARWGVITSTFSGIVSILATHWLLPVYGLAGAFMALVITFGIHLLVTLSLKSVIEISEQEVQ